MNEWINSDSNDWLIEWVEELEEKEDEVVGIA